eukprot:CAMPEP_0204529304 /NCGR_PEP_ID=MMETSP0661-20131031/9992_1 /ASSEMBLY_ACC=CAM_ASM_000606 /TAXON_ID=109239 /ORGANISM="Alexandrium margalefi, Strain AMGDE01CS-322" /LENGTH=543 /DNA_ID=CAMNT_0051535321 /DNA_START=69 /DNA_END=1700 /DNA_ORIENTATION=-
MSDEESGSGAEFMADDGEGGDGGPCGSIMGSCAMLVLGLVLFPAALFLLGWNEQTYVCENSRILYADSHVKAVGCESKGIADEFAFLSCPLVQSSLETFTMLTFNKQYPMSPGTEPPIKFTSVSGKQRVEMYQCEERCETKTTKNSMGQNVKHKVCRYSMAWSSSPVNSADFSRPLNVVAQGCPGIDQVHGNPVAPSNLDMGESSDYASDVLVGDPADGFMLNRDLVTRLLPDVPVDLAPFQGRFALGQTAASQNIRPWIRPLEVTKDNVMVVGSHLQTCATAMLGCVRIGFYRSNSTNPSMMTKVLSGGQTAKEPVPGSWGCKPNDWQAIIPQKATKDEMITVLQDMNRTRVWILRIVGLVLAWMAVWCCFQPISAAAEIAGDCMNMCPCGGYIDDFLTGLVDSVICFLSCSIGCSSGLFVIAIVWLYMRPLIGGLVLTAGILLCLCAFGVRSMSSKSKRPRKGGGRRGRAPVDPSLAQGFLEAARQEYVYGTSGAVGDFFDHMEPEDQEALEPFEAQVRDADDREGEIRHLQATWGLGSDE